MKLVSIVGARPQFIKAAVVSREIRKVAHEVLIHTGQHYDYDMSDVFFDQLGIPSPDYQLGIGSGPHGAQTGRMLAKLEAVLHDEAPDWVVVYGDTNSTLAGALAAAKLNLRIAHVEAGLRSHNRAMPEEINRIVADHVSDLLFCPTDSALDNLRREGIFRGAHKVGDVMLDALMAMKTRVADEAIVLNHFGVCPKEYLLVTIHRASNTDNAANLSNLISALEHIDEDILFPVHPRTRKAFGLLGRNIHGRVRLVDPVGYLEMLALEQHARMILTDSGGVQKEAYMLEVPCVTLREETEWVETVEAGWNILVGADPQRILDAVRQFAPSGPHPPLFGDGTASRQIIQFLAWEA